MLVLTSSTLYFLNITSNCSTTKAPLTGLVQNWPSAVVPPNSSKGPGTRACTPTNLNTALSGFKVQLATTHSSGALVPLLPVNSVILDTSGICIGLGEGDNEIYECPVGIKVSDAISLSYGGEEFELDPAMGIESNIEIVDANSRIDEACTQNVPPKFKKSVRCPINTTDSTTVKLSESKGKALSVKKVKTDIKVKTEPVDSDITVPLCSECPPKAKGINKPHSA
ncbi:hypothetical protein PAXRUDRAFT_28578 [Paxillus rubicundulus Ve08.2h10]|uniref:Uncharacterized protein n=1 Tax=Paxillus rubicundulus Ve08.2h10 TaxID=930991 RepID=A0A0D0CT80_9AGAM|nr:hypothetical protein PAXRUDRAFT_28578 [Paxillus rubicundulus Ve08.2h10]